MTEMEMIDQRKSLYHKIHEARKLVNQADWAPDSVYPMGSTIVRYISADKIKRTMAPILVECGLEFVPVYGRPREEKELPKKPLHWTIKLTGTLVDIDTGLTVSSVVYGESSAVDDKGVSMAETVALRRFFEQMFLIADMLDTAKPEGSTYSKPAGAEAEEVRSKVLGNGTKVEKPAPKPSKPAPKPSKPVPKPSKPVEEKPEQEFKIDIATIPEDVAVVNRNMIEKMVEEWFNAYSEGTVSTERYGEMCEAFNNIENNLDAASFIKKYRKVNE